MLSLLVERLTGVMKPVLLFGVGGLDGNGGALRGVMPKFGSAELMIGPADIGPALIPPIEPGRLAFGVRWVILRFAGI